VPRNGSFGADAIQALLDNVTMPEFQGKLIVVLGGYEDDIEKLFDVNPGMRSRFDKRRVHFPEWSAETAVKATVKAAVRDRMKLSAEAEREALRLFKILRTLPHWASARDFDTVYKSMFQKRARRIGKLMRERQQVAGGHGRTPPDLAAPLEPYEAEDVQAAFKSIIETRGGDTTLGMDGSLDVGARALGADDDDVADGLRGIGGGGGGGGDDTPGPAAASGGGRQRKFSNADPANSTPVAPTLKTLKAYTREVNDAPHDRVVVVFFTAAWCGPSKELKPKFLKMAGSREYANVSYFIVDGDENRDAMTASGATCFPTTKIYVGGKCVATIEGGDKERLIKEKVREHSLKISLQSEMRGNGKGKNKGKASDSAPYVSHAHGGGSYEAATGASTGGSGSHLTTSDAPDEGQPKAFAGSASAPSLTAGSSGGGGGGGGGGSGAAATATATTCAPINAKPKAKYKVRTHTFHTAFRHTI